MSDAPSIVEALLENDDIDPKEFVDPLKPTTLYRHIVFLQYDDATEAERILNEEGEDAVIDYMANWDYGEGEITTEKPWGDDDDVYRSSDDSPYVLTYNTRMGYFSLTAVENTFTEQK